MSPEFILPTQIRRLRQNDHLVLRCYYEIFQGTYVDLESTTEWLFS